MSTSKNPIYLYRITDYRNLGHVMNNGICCRNSEYASCDYVDIGHKNLIEKRGNKKVPVAPYGVLSDYVPFYYAPRSPMLYSIHKGFADNNYTGTQKDIIYIVCSFNKMKTENLLFVITDGHAFEIITRYYNTESDFNKIDWNIMGSKYWNNTDDDPDRKRRRMAEFLVYNNVPVNCICAIVVYNNDMKNVIEKILNNYNFNIKVTAKNNWYY